MNPVRDNDDSNDTGRPDMKPRILDAAIELANRGLSVFPLARGTKIPCRGSAGFHDATTDIDQIGEWWTASPDGNVGVRTEGLAVVDLDLYHPRARESWDRIIKMTRPESFPSSWTSRTGRGGMHRWYQLTDSEDRHLKNGYASCLPINGEIVRLPHIDLKCSGGSYVVAPPSVVPEGAYSWLRRGTLGTAPDWLRGSSRSVAPRAETLREFHVKGSAKRVASICEMVATASIGERNDKLNWGSFHMAEVVIAGVLQRQQAHDALLEAAIEAGLRSLEAKRTILSAFTARGI